MNPIPRPAPPLHRWLVARVPRRLRRSILRFEARTEDEIESFAKSLPERSRLLDAGAGEGQYRQVFAHCRYTGVDLAVGDGAWDYSHLDAVADLEQLPFRDGSFQAAVNIVVLEHTRRPARVLEEICRVLEPGGRLLLVVPQEWGMHQVPHDYFRFTRHGLELLLRQAGFSGYSIAPIGGFFTLLGRRLLDSAVFFTGGWRWALLPLVALLAGPAGLLLPMLDFLDRDKLTTLGYVCVATK
jgi:SAM-dependent methyltransferase